MTNYDHVVQQIALAGLIVSAGLVVDGRVHRVRTEGSKERRGWYLLHNWQSANGQTYIVGTYGIWQGNEKNAQKVTLPDVQMSADDVSAMRLRLAEDRKRAAAQRKAEADAAGRRAAGVWAKALTTPPSGVAVDYLARKAVASYGLRYTDSGALVIPMMDNRAIVHGLQFILPRSHPRVQKTGRDKEYWPAGLQKTGHSYQIGMPSAGGVALLAEGYATAATLHAATGLPVTVAFDAGNLLPVAAALRKTHKNLRILVCADDDYLQKCRECGQPTAVAAEHCAHCGKPHGQINPGCNAAAAAAMAVAGAWVAPIFPTDRAGAKLTDYNDLQQLPEGGIHLVRAQIDAKLSELGWASPSVPRAPTTQGGGGDASGMVSRLSVDDAVARYFGTYGMGGKALFDNVARRVVHKDDVLNLLPSHGWESLKSHPGWRVVYDHQIGFDPTNVDPAIKCNLWDGWPVLDADAQPEVCPVTRRIVRYNNVTGRCNMLLDLLYNMCGNESGMQDAVYNWVLRWLAYPLQHPGAKMQTALVVHGPQGTGKSRFFEAYAKIFGRYARVLGQEALEDKFNADWAEAKQFILADEVMARSEMFHIKNRLKAMVTGDTIRVNPKNVAAHNEKNQMNIVFTSNERMPLVLEDDDRRYCVIWVPPKPAESFFTALNAEIDAGGIVALHDYLLRLDLEDFKPWTKPPMTRSKGELIQQSLSSEDRFLALWIAGDIEGYDGATLPLCPCLGSQLYEAYQRWCSGVGERTRRMQDLIGLAGKRPGWDVGRTHHTWMSLQDRTDKVRKMVIPSAADLQTALALDKTGTRHQQRYLQDRYTCKGEWLSAGYHGFTNAMGQKPLGPA